MSQFKCCCKHEDVAEIVNHVVQAATHGDDDSINGHIEFLCERGCLDCMFDYTVLSVIQMQHVIQHLVRKDPKSIGEISQVIHECNSHGTRNEDEQVENVLKAIVADDGSCHKLVQTVYMIHQSFCISNDELGPSYYGDCWEYWSCCISGAFALILHRSWMHDSSSMKEVLESLRFLQQDIASKYHFGLTE